MWIHCNDCEEDGASEAAQAGILSTAIMGSSLFGKLIGRWFILGIPVNLFAFFKLASERGANGFILKPLGFFGNRKGRWPFQISPVDS